MHTRVLLVVMLLAPYADAQSPAKLSTIFSFPKRQPDGEDVYSGIVIGPAGELYGTTSAGGKPSGEGTSNAGVVFELTPGHPGQPWAETILYAFDTNNPNSDAANPRNVVLGANGALYGATGDGGTFNFGALFELLPPASPGGAWVETVQYNFTGQGVHGVVQDSLVMGTDGVLFGVAGAGNAGACGTCGVVFALSPPTVPGGSWMETILYNFTGQNGDGANPSGLTMGTNGTLYGSTQSGGLSSCPFNPQGCGTVFELSPPSSQGMPWTETILYQFTGLHGDGAVPVANLISDASGTLYGTTYDGGIVSSTHPSGSGTVFSLTPPVTPGAAWSERVLYKFKGEHGDGYSPQAPVAFGLDGALYGTTTSGGSNTACKGFGCGTVYKLSPPVPPKRTWTEMVLHRFTGLNDDGAYPYAGLTLSSNGTFYGTTLNGGTCRIRPSCGTVFELQP